MAGMYEYEKSKAFERSNTAIEHRQAQAVEAIADQLWGIHMELIAIREKMQPARTSD